MLNRLKRQNAKIESHSGKSRRAGRAQNLVRKQLAFDELDARKAEGHEENLP